MKSTQSLNVELINSRLSELGLNQSSIASNLKVSREIVSKWLKNINFPKPKHLLELGKILKIKFSELVITDNKFEPVVEFRKAKSSIITPERKQHAQRMGETLEILMPYLPEPILTVPAVLNNPVNDYEYIRRVVSFLREKHEYSDSPIRVPGLLNLLKSLNIILIPVLWGKKENYRNALHIFLPKTESSWIFVNLDSLATEFNFWIAHELGHVISKNINIDESESFNDSFAAEFLFPHTKTERLYYNIVELKKSNQIEIIKNYAKEYFVSLTCIYLQLKKFTVNNNLKPISLDNDIHKINSIFNKEIPKVSDLLFSSLNRSGEEYVRICETHFGTPIFKALRKYSLEKTLTPGFIQQLFDVSVVDAKSLQKVLADGIN